MKHFSFLSQFLIFSTFSFAVLLFFPTHHVVAQWSESVNTYPSNETLGQVRSKLLIDGTGTAHLFYISWKTDITRKLMYINNKSGAWGNATNLHDGFCYDPLNPALDPSDDQHIGITFVCNRSNTERDILFIESFDGGSSWEEPEIVSQGNGVTSNLVFDETGNPRIAIEQHLGDWRFAITYTSRELGVWKTPQVISRIRDGIFGTPTIFYDCNEGNLHVIYLKDGKNDLLHTFLEDGSSTWSKPQSIDIPVTFGALKVIALEGIWHAVWQVENYADNTDGGFTVLYATSEDMGETWSSPFTISTGQYRAVAPDIAVNEKGEVAITWYELDNKVAYARISDNRGSFSEKTIKKLHIEATGYLNVKAYCNNGFLFSYTDANDTGGHYWTGAKVHTRLWGSEEPCGMLPCGGGGCSPERFSGAITGTLSFASSQIDSFKRLALNYGTKNLREQLDPQETLPEETTSTNNTDTENEPPPITLTCTADAQVQCNFSIPFNGLETPLANSWELAEPKEGDTPTPTPTDPDDPPPPEPFISNLNVIFHFSKRNEPRRIKSEQEKTGTQVAVSPVKNFFSRIIPITQQISLCETFNVGTVNITALPLEGFVLKKEEDTEGDIFLLQDYGDPLAEATVTISGTGEPFALVTDYTGAFKQEITESGSYTITAEKEGYSSATVTIDVVDDPFVVRMLLCPVNASSCTSEVQALSVSDYLATPYPTPDHRQIDSALSALSTEETALGTYVNLLLTWLLTIAGASATLATVLTGLKLTTSGSNPDARKAALRRLMQLITALVLIFGAWILVPFAQDILVVNETMKVDLTRWTL